VHDQSLDFCVTIQRFNRDIPVINLKITFVSFFEQIQGRKTKKQEVRNINKLKICCLGAAPISFVIGLLMYGSVHFAALFFANGTALIVTVQRFYLFPGIQQDSYVSIKLYARIEGK